MNAVILINKDKGKTSRDVVNSLTKVFNTKRIGHTGTLDPIAQGVLVICINKYTKLVNSLMSLDKQYIGTITLGVKTDTFDITGKVLEQKDVSVSKENIEKVFSSLIGKYEQVVPIYSAKKVNGKKLYEYARKGQNIEVPKREIEIYEIELLNVDKQNKKIEYKVHCSKGTYIRSLCEDIAKKLGTIGYMASLERLKVGKFMLEDSISIDNLENDNIETHIIPIEEIFKNSDKIELNHRKLELFLNGVKLTQKFPNGVYRIYCENKFIGTGIIKENLLKRDVII